MTKLELITDLKLLKANLEKEIKTFKECDMLEDIEYNKGYIQAIEYISTKIELLEEVK